MSDEQETLDNLKEWWSENGRWVIAGLVLGLAGILGWQQWNAYQDRVAVRASEAYLQLNAALEANLYSDAVVLAEQLYQDHPRSPYADQAMLRLAGLYVEFNQPQGAAIALRRVVDNTSDAELRSLAALRLARVLYDEGDYNGALAALNHVGDRGFGARAEEIRGDILHATGDAAAAGAAYQRALVHPDRDLIDVNLLILKLDNLLLSSSQP